jgi:three-Cys-motif partner protein
MGEPQEPSVGPWAREKLESLRAYLDFYAKVLKNQSWVEETWFIDGFAGGGLARVRPSTPRGVIDPASLFEDDPQEAPEPEEVAYIKGSPRVALEIANPFDHYIFIEKRPVRVLELEALRGAFPARRIEILAGDANVELQRFLGRPTNWRANRGVVFLDPFGMQVSWTTLAAIARTRALEVFLNFPLHMAITRVLTRSGDIPDAWRHRLDVMFGSENWRDLAYEGKPSLLGETVSKREDAADRLLQWYRNRLRTEFGHVSDAQLVNNTKGRPLYYLIWAGPHVKGLTGADYILGGKGKGAKAGSSRDRQTGFEF